MNSINFYLKKPEPVSGKSLIFLQYKYRNNRLVFSTGENVYPGMWKGKMKGGKKVYEGGDWDFEKQMVKTKNATTANGDIFLNDLLDELKSQCEIAYKKELINGIPPVSVLRQHLKTYLHKRLDAEKVIQHSLWDLIDRFISGEVRDEENKEKSANTLKGYNNVKNHLLAFEKKYKYRVTFESINQDFLDKYLNYLEKDAELSNNTIAKNFQILKTFLNEGHDRHYHTNIWYKKKLKRSWEESENIALTRREINKLYNHDFSENKKLERVRDLFVVGCNLGLRISDLSNIKPHNIIDVEGEKRIRIKTQKTGQMVEIAAHDQVTEVLEKYNGALPAISDQKFNSYIKIACEEAGLTTKSGLQNSPDKRLCDCVSSHTMRRTFATVLYNEGLDALVIRKITGHKSETAFLKYIKVSESDAASKQSAHYRKLKQSNLIAV